MTEVVLFHHALGLTGGVTAFADELRAAGHTVHTPDLFEGRRFPDVGEGVAYAEATGFGTLVERGARAAAELPDAVYAGFSLGVLPAQMLAQTRPHARGALLMHSCIPPEEFGDWPAGLPGQIHLTEGDEWVLPPNEDLAVARRLQAAGRAELFLYAGDAHLFAERGHPDHDEEAAGRLTRRLLAFLATADPSTA
jgi:dienelactone hydrolase